ncbi:cytochrome c peroxidase [Planctomyces sp. SH-PL14]|uniref:cytochrome c peroxidase n=1 Tax=Planctomyces sp. SH-PL14 TaxID=1632864 RepID=UPI0018D369C8|nr:cytochrome c peroxidase [Planctomyces sp. SH-PL14]
MWVLSLCFALVALREAGAAPPLDDQAALRKPVDAISAAGGLLVANQESHSLSFLNAPLKQVEWESPLGSSPVALVSLGNTVGVLDFQDHLLRVVAVDPTGLRTIGQAETVRWPVAIVALTETRLAVAGLWSRQIQFLERSNSSDQWTEAGVLRLPFNPRCLLPIGEGRLLVGDAFRGRLAVIDTTGPRIESIREIHAHNIHGLVLSPDGESVYLTHQLLDERAATTHENVSLGILLSNLVRRIPLDALRDPGVNLESVSFRYFLGRTLEGAADPNGLAFAADGTLWVALGGTNELCEVSADGIEIRRHPAGTRPTRVLRRGDEIVTLDTLGDSLSIHRPGSAALDTVPLGPQRELSRAELGERLFYNGRLSLESWMSCNSCHPDGHTHGLVADTASDGGFGNPKRTLSLLGTRDANPWAWNGQFRELHEQVRQSVTSSMQGPPVKPAQEIDLVSFLHTLRPPPPVDEVSGPEDAAQIERGRILFGKLGCAGCHIPPVTYTIDSVFDVGMPDERGQAKFNPPTLRGVSQRDRLFHDNRAASLESVLDEFGHQLPRPLDRDERSDLLRFLRSL